MPLYLLGASGASKIERYSKTSWKVFPLPAEALSTHNGDVFRSIDASILRAYFCMLKNRKIQ